MTGPARQPPPTDPFTQVFLDYLARGELHLPYCASCDRGLDLGERVCPRDGSAEISWRAASGNATLYSFVVYRRQYLDDFPVPYNVALVELAEGPRLISTVLLDDEAVPEVGMKLRAEFDESGRLVFRPADP